MRFISLVLLTACLITACRKENEVKQEFESPALVERDSLYCELSKPMFEKAGNTAETKCDAALFTALHGLQCGYVEPSIFEYKKTGKLCRRPGCTCFDNATETSETSDSGFSKDAATGLQVYYSAKPDKSLAKRVTQYIIDTKNFVCSALDKITLVSKCVMSPKIIYRWSEIEKKASDIIVEGLSKQPKDEESDLKLVTKSGPVAHVAMLGVITEYNLYKGISDKSLELIKAQAAKEPNNLVYQAMYAKFVAGNEEEIKDRLLKMFPADRLPNSSDYCTSYLFQRDEFRGAEKNKDWEPCGEKITHFGTDYLVASYILQLR